MSMLVPYAAQIIPRTRRVSATSFIYCYERGSEIQSGQEQGAVTVYGLLEVLSDAETADTTAQSITDQLDRLFAMPTEDVPDKPTFDQVASDINTAITKQSDGPQINAAIVHLENDQLSVIHTGKAEAHMNRGRSFVRITESLPQQVSDKQAAFSEVATGNVKSGDKLLLATPGLLHHISVDQIKNSIMDNTPATSATKLARFVDGRPDANRAAAVIVEIAAPEYLAEFASGGITTVVDIGSKESFGEVAKASTVPVVRKTGRKVVILARRFGHWTVAVVVPTTKKATKRSVDGLKAGYKKIRSK